MRGALEDAGPMRIFMSTDVVGGVWNYSAQLARGLVDAGHEVMLAVIGRAGAERLSDLPPAVEVIEADYRLEWIPGAEEDVREAAEWLASAARQWGADVAHLNQLAYAGQDYGAPTLVVVHSDVLSWFSETHGTEAPREWDPYSGWVRDGLEAADRVVAPSGYQSRLTRRHYGRGADLVIHNGIVAPSESPLPRSTPLVVSAGRAWDEAKGMRVLDDAAELLGGGGPEVHIIGDATGPQGQRFSGRCSRSHGRLPGDEVDAWLSRASIYAGASLYEPFGLAPLEAAFRGAALVLSDIPSFRELWDGCATFFPAGDARGLADTIAELAPDLGGCAAMAQAARERALERYTADAFTARYLELYAGMRLTLETKPSCV